MTHRIDVLSVGDIVSDAFIRLLPAEAELDKDPVDKHPLLCMTYGSKVPLSMLLLSTVSAIVQMRPSASLA